ncbi:hypothetical protein PFICI_03866 [Pestalotiopsis fici W106-1]|uniref:Vacuolar amino acid transporter YPQ3 n=1 Tax=Pestalotiopsis fici (strain W106-1 / CGMCC3.15140) TaxID=1229662 RepID=W3XKT5_PESFW|nr:uncharacterized protein PFICI_03866 [Pestalotiopsis fici W106-1]ETS85841.1 hypothetical protein PFICI_03866 [Pestalotiopsis fici W106-1]
MDPSKDVPPVKVFSNVLGCVSLVAWIFVLVPQLLENYRTKRTDGLSVGFLIIWILGDIANLSGALVTGIAPSAIQLAAYFCLSDAVLIAQYVYYNAVNAERAHRMEGSGDHHSETSPLINPRRTQPGGGAYHQRPGSATQEESGLHSSLPTAPHEQHTSGKNYWLQNVVAVVAVYLIGVLVWYVSDKAGLWNTVEEPNMPTEDTPLSNVGIALGYLSAVLYLCARIPQILKNHRQKSCEGLAILLFIFSVTGNLTYGLSISLYSQESHYVSNMIPWLVGSLGTILEDFVIFYQFRLYSPRRRLPTAEET